MTWFSVIFFCFSVYPKFSNSDVYPDTLRARLVLKTPMDKDAILGLEVNEQHLCPVWQNGLHEQFFEYRHAAEGPMAMRLVRDDRLYGPVICDVALMNAPEDETDFSDPSIAAANSSALQQSTSMMMCCSMRHRASDRLQSLLITFVYSNDIMPVIEGVSVSNIWLTRAPCAASLFHSDLGRLFLRCSSLGWSCDR